MNFLTFAYVFGFILALGHAGVPCQDNSECQAVECCQILSQYMVVSKRGLMDSSDGGTCEPYQVEFDNCDPLAKMNGYCSCAPGLSCHVYQRPISNVSRGRRGALPPPADGMEWVSKCEKV